MFLSLWAPAAAEGAELVVACPPGQKCASAPELSAELRANGADWALSEMRAMQAEAERQGRAYAGLARSGALDPETAQAVSRCLADPRKVLACVDDAGKRLPPAARNALDGMTRAYTRAGLISGVLSANNAPGGDVKQFVAWAGKLRESARGKVPAGQGGGPSGGNLAEGKPGAPAPASAAKSGSSATEGKNDDPEQVKKAWVKVPPELANPPPDRKEPPFSCEWLPEAAGKPSNCPPAASSVDATGTKGLIDGMREATVAALLAEDAERQVKRKAAQAYVAAIYQSYLLQMDRARLVMGSIPMNSSDPDPRGACSDPALRAGLRSMLAAAESASSKRTKEAGVYDRDRYLETIKAESVELVRLDREMTDLLRNFDAPLSEIEPSALSAFMVCGTLFTPFAAGLDAQDSGKPCGRAAYFAGTQKPECDGWHREIQARSRAIAAITRKHPELKEAGPDGTPLFRAVAAGKGMSGTYEAAHRSLREAWRQRSGGEKLASLGQDKGFFVRIREKIADYCDDPEKLGEEILADDDLARAFVGCGKPDCVDITDTKTALIACSIREKKRAADEKLGLAKTAALSGAASAMDLVGCATAPVGVGASIGAASRAIGANAFKIAARSVAADALYLGGREVAGEVVGVGIALTESFNDTRRVDEAAARLAAGLDPSGPVRSSRMTWAKLARDTLIGMYAGKVLSDRHVPDGTIRRGEVPFRVRELSESRSTRELEQKIRSDIIDDYAGRGPGFEREALEKLTTDELLAIDKVAAQAEEAAWVCSKDPACMKDWLARSMADTVPPPEPSLADAVPAFPRDPRVPTFDEAVARDQETVRPPAREARTEEPPPEKSTVRPSRPDLKAVKDESPLAFAKTQADEGPLPAGRDVATVPPPSRANAETVPPPRRANAATVPPPKGRKAESPDPKPAGRPKERRFVPIRAAADHPAAKDVKAAKIQGTSQGYFIPAGAPVPINGKPIPARALNYRAFRTPEDVVDFRSRQFAAEDKLADALGVPPTELKFLADGGMKWVFTFERNGKKYAAAIYDPFLLAWNKSNPKERLRGLKQADIKAQERVLASTISLEEFIYDAVQAQGIPRAARFTPGQLREAGLGQVKPTLREQGITVSEFIEDDASGPSHADFMAANQKKFEELDPIVALVAQKRYEMHRSMGMTTPEGEEVIREMGVDSHSGNYRSGGGGKLIDD